MIMIMIIIIIIIITKDINFPMTVFIIINSLNTNIIIIKKASKGKSK